MIAPSASSGELALALSGSVPRKGKPVKVDDEIVIRKEFAALVDEMKNEAHAVVSLRKGNSAVDNAAAGQSKKAGTTAATPEAMPLRGIRSGNAILVAHGGREEANGTIIGTRLGKKTAAELVDLLTENSDENQVLHPDFSGTVWLFGCFSASGGIAPPATGATTSRMPARSGNCSSARVSRRRS